MLGLRGGPGAWTTRGTQFGWHHQAGPHHMVASVRHLDWPAPLNATQQRGHLAGGGGGAAAPWTWTVPRVRPAPPWSLRGGVTRQHLHRSRVWCASCSLRRGVLAGAHRSEDP